MNPIASWMQRRISPTKKALAVYEVLHKEFVSLGAINSENILDGLEVDLRIAKAINMGGL
jgi:hypothetical protein